MQTSSWHIFQNCQSDVLGSSDVSFAFGASVSVVDRREILKGCCVIVPLGIIINQCSAYCKVDILFVRECREDNTCRGP